MSVTKNAFVNIVIGLLVVLTLLALCRPCFFTENDSASVMSYICNPTVHGEITAYLTELNPNFSLNAQVIVPFLLFLLGALSVALLIAKHGMTVSLICPIGFSVLGIIGVWNNELTRAGGAAALPTVLMLLILALCAYNGTWVPGGDSEWKPDPQAKSKLKEIEKAVAKKKLPVLKAYASSRDLSLRTAAIEAIGRVGGAEAFQPLVGQLSCAEPEVRIAAARALGELGDLRGRTYILHFMKSDRDSRVRSAMRDALAKLPTAGE